MRAFAAVVLGLSLTAMPLMANDANNAGTEESSALTSASSPKETAKPENAVESEVQDLRNLVEEQRQELLEQRAALKALAEKLNAQPAAPAITPVAASSTATPTVATLATPAPAAIGVPSTPAQKSGEESPLYFKIGAAEFYPLGFLDLTNVFRTTQLGTIGTSFGSIAFNNTAAGRITEDRLSAQNSRIGLRTHAKFGEADVTGYLEADFLGYQPANANDTSNSNTLRMRLYWVDYKRGMWEVLGGQSWSMLTPNRVGISAMPGDVFYGQEMDTNYLLGLTWARQAGIRVLGHVNNNWTVGLALENPEQTLPSSVTVPTAGGSGYVSQFDSNSGNTSSATGVNNPNTPNLFPDVIAKLAFDAQPGGHHVHFDVAGLLRTFKALNVIATPSTITSANTVTTTANGGGIEGGMNLELVKNLRFIATAFYSDGGGRYIASTAGPDVVIRPNGTISPVRSGSGIGGFEWQANPNWMIYGYYSGAYFGRNWYSASACGGSICGYGFPGSGNNNNRYLYEPTFGVNHTMWKNPSYGDIKVITQYSYVSRTPWAVGTGPHTAHNSMVYIDLRYDLP